MSQETELLVYVGRVSAPRYRGSDLNYIYPDKSIVPYRGDIRFLSFFASPEGQLPESVRVDEVKAGGSRLSAVEGIYIKAGGNAECANCIGFIADANLAGELPQLALINRISALLLCPETLAAMKKRQFSELAEEMTQKGVELLCKGWCEQAVIDKQLVPHFEKLAKCLQIQ